MSVKQSYDDWTRMLNACLIVVNGDFDVARLNLRGTGFAWLQYVRRCKKNDIEMTKSYEKGYEVARELGIDKVSYQQWKPSRDSNEHTAGPFVVCYRAFGTWEARAPGIEVTGHPDAESAMSHLETLMGRNS